MSSIFSAWPFVIQCFCWITSYNRAQIHLNIFSWLITVITLLSEVVTTACSRSERKHVLLYRVFFLVWKQAFQVKCMNSTNQCQSIAMTHGDGIGSMQCLQMNVFVGLSVCVVFCLRGKSLTSRRYSASCFFLELKAGTLKCDGLGPSAAGSLSRRTQRRYLPSCEYSRPNSGSMCVGVQLLTIFCSVCRTAAAQTAGRFPRYPASARGWWELEAYIVGKGMIWSPRYCWSQASSPLSVTPLA